MYTVLCTKEFDILYTKNTNHSVEYMDLFFLPPEFASRVSMKWVMTLNGVYGNDANQIQWVKKKVPFL